MRKIWNLISDLDTLLYPRLCRSCLEVEIKKGDHLLCYDCVKDLLYTNYFEKPNNDLFLKLRSQVQLEKAAALWYYYDHSIAQNLIHNFKYKKYIEIGEKMSNILADDIIKSNFNKDIDAIIAIPMTKVKEDIRGFNQSMVIAKQISLKTNIPILYDTVIKLRNTESQTTKSKAGREKNAEVLFKVAKPNVIKGKHILLVDDVITTGSTISSCGMELIISGASKISMVALAATVSSGDLLETARN